MGRRPNMNDRVRGPYWHRRDQTWVVEVVRPRRRTRFFTFKDRNKADVAAAMSPADLLATVAPRRHHRRHAVESVYFIRAENGPIKIGRAKDVKARIADLQQAHWTPLQLLAVSRNISEKDTHRRFAHLRIRGEWFNAASELLAFVEEISSVVSYGSPSKMVGP